MVDKKFGKNVLMVILSNGVKLLSSVLSMFAIPLLFSQQDYGFYELFLLYISYVGIFHFGFIDGLYLIYAGKNYDQLSKQKFRRFTNFFLKLETIVMILALILSLFFKGQRQIMLILTAINLIILNMTTYFQFISQITERFKEFAIRNILFTVLNVTLIGTFYIFKIKSYILFIIMTTIINAILLLWYLFTYRDIMFGKKNSFSNEKSDITTMFKVGIPLLMANFISILMTNIPQQFVDMQYPVKQFPTVFSNFSFAFTFLGFTSVFLFAIIMV